MQGNPFSREAGKRYEYDYLPDQGKMNEMANAIGNIVLATKCS